MKDRPPTELKGDPGDPDMDTRYGFAILAPFAVLAMVIAVFKVLFLVFKPKSTLTQEKEKIKNKR